MATKKTPSKPVSPKKAPSKPASPKKVATAKVAPESQDASGKRKPSMHHRYREITVIMTDGQTFQTRSTYPHDSLKLEIDITTHPAWTKESNFVNTKANKVSDFSSRYQGLDFLKS